MRNALSLSFLTIKHLSAGVWIISSLFILSGAYLLTASFEKKSENLQMWVFSPEHAAMYEPVVDQLNAASTDESVKDIDMSILSIAAIQSRMMSGFFGGLPTADLIEVERATVGQAFMGPPEGIGFRDLTDRLKAEGIYDQFNVPSLSPWSVNGRVFGLPHDVHPVMLAYRADLTEAAGIDLTQADTWEKYFEMLRPLMVDKDNDGQTDHYPLSMWVTQPDNLELLMLQGGGELFDAQGLPTLNSQLNAELLGEIVSWSAGDEPLTADINEFSAAGHQARVDGLAIGYLAPDWMCSIWKVYVPGIEGKMKVMPLPAFTPGGRRTSVRGGTMLGFPKTSEHFDQSWEAAIELYTSPEIARELYRKVDIISPIRSLWNDPVYSEPDPFFMNQPKGQMYIELAPDIPLRTSSPYNLNALLLIRDVAIQLLEWANNDDITDPALLAAEAQSRLDGAQKSIERQMSRNAFMGVDTQ